jgi:hypothetical protein
MTELKKLAELNVLICEAQAIGLEADAMKVANCERKMQNESPMYTEVDFMYLVRYTKKIADKFMELGCVK